MQFLPSPNQQLLPAAVNMLLVAAMSWQSSGKGTAHAWKTWSAMPSTCSTSMRRSWLSAALTLNGPSPSIHPHVNFEEWYLISNTVEDETTISFLKYGFPAGYKGPVPTPCFGNYPSATKHHSDVTTYIKKELSEVVVLGPI